MCNQKRRENTLAAYPAIFHLQEDESSSSGVRMSTLESLPQQERPDLLIIVTQPTRHIRAMWGIEKVPFSYANRTALDGHIVTFSHDIVAGDTPTTIAISDEWWDCEDRPVHSQQTAATKVSKLRPEDHSIPDEATGAEILSIPLACIMPLALIHPLLTAPYMSRAAAYTLLSARTAAWNWDAPLDPLMRWLRAYLYPTCPGVTSLPPLEMTDHITVVQKALQRQLVPRITAGPATLSPIYIVHQAQQATQAAPENKNPCRALGPKGCITVSARQRSEARRTTRYLVDPRPPHKREGATRIRNIPQGQHKSAKMQSPPDHTRSGSPPTRNPLLHQRS